MNKNCFSIVARVLVILLAFLINFSCFAKDYKQLSYIEHNTGQVQFNISLPIDATGFILHGENLQGGKIDFTDHVKFVKPLLAIEAGHFTLPIAKNKLGKLLMKTTVRYHAVKFIAPIGVDNFFIKIGQAVRTQKVSGLDPVILKAGSYTWQVPIFSVGLSSNNSMNVSNNRQFMLIAGTERSNAMYTKQFYLYTRGVGNKPIAAHPITIDQSSKILSVPYTSHYSGYANVNWVAFGDIATTLHGAGGRSIGKTVTFPAGPNVDYEYGSFQLPTMHTHWSGPKSTHCTIKGKLISGCVSAKIASSFSYIAQKIRVPIGHGVTLYAESGSAYRKLIPDNVRISGENFYNKKLVNPQNYLKTSYLPGGYIAPYFSVGFEFQSKRRIRYSARYIYIPINENSNRLTWNDAPQIKLYVISVSSSGDQSNHRPSEKVIKENFAKALRVIQRLPQVYSILSKQFFMNISRHTEFSLTNLN